MGGVGSGRPKGKGTKSRAPEGTAESWDAAAREAGKLEQKRLPLSADDVVIARVDRELPSTLSVTELEHLAGQHVEKQARAYQLEEEIKAFAKPRKKELAELEKEIRKLTEEQHSKVRMVVVPCREEHDYRVNTVRIYRLDEGPVDVGVLIEQRAMTGEEREKATFDPPDGAPIEVEEG